LNSFTKKEVLDRHREYCGKHDFVRITMPEKGSTLEFKTHKHSMRVPVAVYADFECMTKPIQSCQPNLEHSYTEQYQKHEPSGFCFYIVYDGKKLEAVLYTKQSEDENVAEIFCKRLWNYIEKVWSSDVQPMVMTDDDEIDFDNRTQCWISQKDFTEKDKKVCDPCHFTGNNSGAAHQKCNALFRKPKFVPVKFHNLSGYDAHLYVKNLNMMGECDTDYIPNTEEKYISFSKSTYDDEKKFKYKIRFIDSFMPASLDKLAGNLEPNQFKNTRETFSDECDFLLRNCVFPYDWFDSFEKLDEKNFHEKRNFIQNWMILK